MNTRPRRLALLPALAVALLCGCGGKTSLDDAPEMVSVEPPGQASPASSSFVEQCYLPGKGKNPASPCLRASDPGLPDLLPDCPAPAQILVGPITDINTTTGVVRCCYEVSDESCAF